MSKHVQAGASGQLGSHCLRRGILPYENALSVAQAGQMQNQRESQPKEASSRAEPETRCQGSPKQLYEP